jgi:hypothetical protein
MRKEIVQLELIRQQIEQEMYDSGSASDYIDRGNPDPRQLKQATDFIASQEDKIARLQEDFRIQLRKCDPKVIQEWVELHKAILQRILTEKVTNAHTKTRHFVAKNTLDEWEKVRAGEADFVNINWHFLKDYKEEVRKLVNRKWWQVWK